MSEPNDEVSFATAAHPEAARAAAFRESFEPKEGVDYEWVEDRAKEQYEEMHKAFDDLDAKATSIINYLSSGAGLFTLGSLAGVAAAKVPTTVIWCALPSMCFAVAAIVAALLARWPRRIFRPPAPDQMVKLAEHYPNDTKRARALMLPQWQWVTALLRAAVEDKAWYVGWSVILMGAAVAFLLLPLLVTLCGV